jgi:hypothetical protein
LEAKAIYLHPLLGLVDCLQVPGHHCRVYQIVREQLYPTTTTRGGFRHRRRADGLCVLDLWGADRHLQSNLWWYGGLLSAGRRGGFLGDLLHRLRGSFSSFRCRWCRLLHRHRRRDIAPFGLDAWQEDVKFISNYDYSMGKIKPIAEHLPSTTLASGNAASAAGASDSTWGAGVDSSTGGATSSSATVAEGSSPSQDKSVDFLQKYTKLVVIQARLLHQVLLGKV